MTEINFRPARLTDVGPIARRMREIDRIECAAVGLTPKAALRAGLRWSDLVWTGTINDKPEAMFGVVVTALVMGEGRPWFLGTDAARSNARAFLEIAPAYLAMIEAAAPNLSNHVHRDNAASIRWLRRLGFVVEPEVVQIGTEPMRYFWKGNR